MKRTFIAGLIILVVLDYAIAQSQPKDRIKNNQLYYQQDLRVPMTKLTLVFHGGGSQQEGEELAGLARITAKMLFRGTPDMAREAIEKTFELLGADVSANVSETDFVISIACFSRNLDEVLKLVSTITKNADFPQHELELVKKQELGRLDAALQNAERVLAKGKEYALFGGLRFGKFGSRRAISRISREDVQQYYAKVRGTAVLYFTAISNLSKPEIEKKLSEFSTGRATNGFVLKPETPYKNSQGREAVIFNSPGATNDRFRWSHRGIEATDERRFDLALVMDALGSSTGFLFDQLRNKKGWCYGAYAFVMRPTTRPGRIAYYADPRSETSDKLIPEMLRLIQLFPDEEDFQDLLARRNAAFKNRYSYRLDLKFRLRSEVNRDRYGMPILDKDSYYKRIDAVNLVSAKKVIIEIFDTNNLFMVFYGDAERIKRIVTKLDPSIKITVLDKEVLVQ